MQILNDFWTKTKPDFWTTTVDNFWTTTTAYDFRTTADDLKEWVEHQQYNLILEKEKVKKEVKKEAQQQYRQ
jgi:hypothetical protein